MIWLPMFLLNCIVMILSYVLNPVVVLFADEDGELPDWCKWFQTWDDSCDVRFFVLENMPKFLQYDFDAKYVETKGTTPELKAVGRERWFTKLKDGATFTTKEKIQRYFCRVGWLMRNCGYGFAFWMFGKTVTGKDLVTVKNMPVAADGTYMKINYNPNENIFMRTFKIHGYQHLFGPVYMDIFIGWKTDDESETPVRAMIANRIVPRFKF